MPLYVLPPGAHPLLGVRCAGDILRPGDPPIELEEPVDPILLEAGLRPVVDKKRARLDRAALEAALKESHGHIATMRRQLEIAQRDLEIRTRERDDALARAQEARDALGEQELLVATRDRHIANLEGELADARRQAKPAPWVNGHPNKRLAFANAQRRRLGREPFTGDGAAAFADEWLALERDALEPHWPKSDA